MKRFERTSDPWRLRMPIPRYLRNSPLRGMRERLWFVSRIEPVVNVTLNLARHVRVERTAAAVPATVVLNRWLTARTAIAEVRREDAAAPAGAPTPALGMPLAPRVILRTSPAPAHVRIPAPPRASPETIEVQPAPETTVVRRLSGRVSRVEETVAAVTTHFVRRHTASTSTESSPPDTSERQRRGQPWQALSSSGSTTTVPPANLAPAVNVDHLTEQVIRQLDRRLIASRERLGRT